MKKALLSLVCLLLVLGFTACGDTPSIEVTTEPDSNLSQDVSTNEQSDKPDISNESTPADKPDESNDDVVDLTVLGSTMLYAELYQMSANMEDYLGKTIIMEGQFARYEYEDTNQVYYVCLVTDDTGCCVQGMEFLLADTAAVYPDDYPEEEATIILTGTFETYEEDGMVYRRLADASFTY